MYAEIPLYSVSVCTIYVVTSLILWLILLCKVCKNNEMKCLSSQSKQQTVQEQTWKNSRDNHCR